MVSSLVDDAPKDIKNIPKIIETDPWLELGLQRLEPHAGSTPLRFEREESGELVGLVEIEIQSERNALIGNYCAYHTTPATAIVLSHDNDAAVSAGIAVSGTVVIGGGVTFGGDVTFGDVIKFGSGVVGSRFAYQPGFRVVARIQSPRSLPLDLEQRLKEFKQLSAGWDSYGSEPISHMAVEKSIILLQDLYTYFKELGKTLPEPFAAPVPDGRIQIEWSGDEKEIEITVDDKGIIEYLLFSGDDVWNYKKGSVSMARELGELLQTEVLRKGNES